MKKLFALALIAVFAVLPVLGLEKSETFYVNDVAGVLDTSVAEYICEENYRLYETCGAEVCVVIVDFISGYDIEDYCYQIFNDWKLGDPELNNGVLILLSAGDHKDFIMPGDGVRNDAVTPEKAQAICDKWFSDVHDTRDYGKAVLGAFKEVVSEIDKKYGTSVPGGYEEEDEGSFALTGIIILIVGFIVVSALINSGSSHRAPRRRSGSNFVFLPWIVNTGHRPPAGGHPHGFGGFSSHSSGGFSSHSSGGFSSHSSGGHMGGRPGGGGGSHGGGGGHR